MRKYIGKPTSGVQNVTNKIEITCKLKLLVLLIISLVTQTIATIRKNIRKIAMIFIHNAIPLALNNEDKLQDDLSSTTPTHVPINILS